MASKSCPNQRLYLTYSLSLFLRGVSLHLIPTVGSGPRKGKKLFLLVPYLILVGHGVSGGTSEGDQGIFSLLTPLLIFHLVGTVWGY